VKVKWVGMAVWELYLSLLVDAASAMVVSSSPWHIIP
jgi:hypothetical protein